MDQLATPDQKQDVLLQREQAGFLQPLFFSRFSHPVDPFVLPARLDTVGQVNDFGQKRHICASRRMVADCVQYFIVVDPQLPIGHLLTHHGMEQGGLARLYMIWYYITLFAKFQQFFQWHLFGAIMQQRRKVRLINIRAVLRGQTFCRIAHAQRMAHTLFTDAAFDKRLCINRPAV